MKHAPKYRIVIIGNGFDLSQGLNTSYSHFIIDYLKNVYVTAIRNGDYEDEALLLDLDDFSTVAGDTIQKIENCDDLTELVAGKFKRLYTKIHHNNVFFNLLITSCLGDDKWIDIEKFYYQKLKQYTINRSEPLMDNVKLLNEMMEFVSNKLKEYLGRVQQEFFDANTVSFDNVKPYLKTVHTVENNGSSDYINTNKLKGVLFLNFNYTNVLGSMIPEAMASKHNIKVINIHGEIDSKKNPTIFGYGDDTSDEYKKLEIADNDQFLINIKSFRYPRTDNYHKVLNFIDNVGDTLINPENGFDVHIVGHSCGLSDKTLLRTIFEDDNCIAITAFHYMEEEEDAYDEHFYKGIAISRHFSDKPSFREKFQTFDSNAKIVQRKVKEVTTEKK